jgi:hypothetical protein
MKLGANKRVNLIAASALATVALVLMGRLIAVLDAPSVAATLGGHNEDGRTEPIGVTKHASNLNALDPTLKYHWMELSERTEYVGTGRDIFRAEIPVSRMPTKGPKPPPVLWKTSSPPPMRLRFFGFASVSGDAKKIFLSDEGDVFIGREGDIIDRRYKILQITPTSVKIEDLIDDVQKTLALDQG